MTTIAINGLGRIGRAFLKAALQHEELRVVAVNDLIDPENLVYLLRFDSSYGRYHQAVAYEPGVEPTLQVGRASMRLLREREPARLPWRKLGVDIVVEATGAFAAFDKARAHITAGAQRVVLTAPAKDADAADARTVLVGVNEDQLDVSVLSSNGSCTTNSASPVMQVLKETIGVKKALLNTVHAYTSSQSLVDGPARGRDFRKGRAAAVNIIPASTGAAIAVGRAIPELRGRFDGLAMRVPVLTGSISSIAFLAGRRTSAEEINQHLEEASRQARWSKVMAVSRDPLVSSDIVGDPHAAIVDLSLTKVVDEDLCSVYSWYDNEYGYTNSLVQHVTAVAAALNTRATLP